MPAKAPSRRPSTDHHRPRLTALRRAMSRAGVDRLLVTDPVDVGYLCGFLGGDSYLLVGPSGKATLVSDARYAEEIAQRHPGVSLRVRSGTLMDEVGAALGDAGAAGARRPRLGVQGEHLTLAQHVELRSALKKAGLKSDAVVTTRGLVADLRAIKDEHEVSLLRKAIRIQERALEETLATIEPGQTELEIRAELEYRMMVLGSPAPSFETIVGARASGSKPHYTPGKIKTAANATVLIDWGATHLGYHGDMTRTFALGRWPKAMAEVYDVVLEAHERAAAALGPGVACKEVDSAARRHITDAGFGDRFGHGTGHGLGMRVHESPRLSQLAGEAVLLPGHVVTIEPGVYLPGVGGVRIEDDYLITERGATNLCTLPKSRRWATL